MKSLLLFGEEDGAVIATLYAAESALERTVGLLGRRRLEPCEGLLLRRCAAIHTIGMRFAIDVVFLDAEFRVVSAVPAVAPNRPIVLCPGARTTIELGAGTLDRVPISRGDRLRLEAAARA